MRQEAREKSLEREIIPSGCWGHAKPSGDGEWEATKGGTQKMSSMLLREFILTVGGGGTVEPDVALKAQRHPVWQLVERFLDLSRKAGGIPWTAALPPLVLGHM